MTEIEYKEMIKKIVLKEDKLKNTIIAFLSGGLIGLLAEVIVKVLTIFLNVDKKDASSIMIVILIFISCFLTSIGIFDNFVSKLKCGLVIPITGFAHAMTSAMIDYKKEGLITGIGTNAFKLTGSVILYGVVSAYIFGIIRYLFFGG